MRRLTVSRALLLGLFSVLLASQLAAVEPMRLDPVTLRTPKTYSADGIVADGVTSVFFDALPWHGKPTRAFAWYGVPKVAAGKKVPGMVLVHGGGGTAFADWVKLWVSRGYAAIAVDTCGSIPVGSYGKWGRHAHAGPPGWGGLEPVDVDQPAEDQWTYHAVSDVALAHSLLASLPGVDAQRIGITGISWGGYLTCISAGLDDRYKLAVPVYGCGFLGENSAWLGNFKDMGAQRAARWLSMWDPSVYLPRVKMPMLWVTGTNDFAYPMDSLQKSYRLTRGPRTLCVTVRMPHGHGGPGENPPEILAFADAILKPEVERKICVLPAISGQGADAKTAWATFNGAAKLARAELVYTCDTGVWQKREWKTLPAKVDEAQKKISADLPAGVKVFYINATTDTGLTVSTEHSMADVGMTQNGAGGK